MTKNTNSKQYDLEDRTANFAKKVREFVKHLKKTLSNIEDGKQVVRSSGSVGANYIEANEALSKKDFKMRIKICRKEAKESRYWLRARAEITLNFMRPCIPSGGVAKVRNMPDIPTLSRLSNRAPEHLNLPIYFYANPKTIGS